jgi:phytanoyl-CoA hydroxylase
VSFLVYLFNSYFLILSLTNFRSGEANRDFMNLTSEQLRQFDQDGFLVIENFVTADRCDQLRARASQMVAEFDPEGVISIFSTRNQQRDDYFLTSGDKIRFFFEAEAFTPDGRLRQRKEESINKIGHALHDLDDQFNSFSRTAALAELATALGFNNPLLLQSMYIFKQPNIGGEVDCHQDSTFLYTEPLSAIGLWFALEDATEENGCLWAIPGGHKVGLKSRYERAPGGGTRMEIFDDRPWQLEQLVSLAVPKGAMIILHGLLPHFSRANRSPRSRHAYTLHLIEGNYDYPASNWLQRSPELPLRGF